MLQFSVIAYLAATLIIGLFAARKVKNSSDFVLAGRKLPLLISAAVMFATWFGSETVLGASSEFIDNGLIGVIEDPFGAALCLILIGLFYARKLYGLNLLTFSDYFAQRFGKMSEFVSAIVLIPSYLGWIAAQLVALALIFNMLFDLPLETGIWFSAGFVLLYTFFGGMWSVSITDFIQTIAIILGLILVAVFLQFKLSDQTQSVFEELPENFFRFLPENNWSHIYEYAAAWITIGLGSIPQQDVFQRVMASKDAKTAVNASVLSGIMYLTIALLPMYIALQAKTLFPKILSENDHQQFIPIAVMQTENILIQVLFFGALISAIFSTTSAAMLAPATVLGENLIKKWIPGLNDKKLLLSIRISLIAVALISAQMAVQQGNIFDLVSQSSAMSLVSLFVPLTAGLYLKKATNVSAIISMLVGFASWLLLLYFTTDVHAMMIGFAASIISFLVVYSFYDCGRPNIGND